MVGSLPEHRARGDDSLRAKQESSAGPTWQRRSPPARAVIARVCVSSLGVEVQSQCEPLVPEASGYRVQ